MSAKLAVMKALIAAWTAGDIDGALSHMSDDIVWHYAAAVAPPLKGKEKARKFLDNFKSQLSEVRWRLFDHAENGEVLFVEGVDEFLSSDGHWVAAPYAGVLRFRGDLICDWRDYVDVGVMDAQRRGEARSKWVADMIDRPAL
jgi:limonene-1,2-epoxide hydrolase